MKWKVPQHGDTRTVKRFAFLPKCINGGEKVWLEKYVTEETYYTYSDGFHFWHVEKSYSL